MSFVKAFKRFLKLLRPFSKALKSLIGSFQELLKLSHYLLFVNFSQHFHFQVNFTLQFILHNISKHKKNININVRCLSLEGRNKERNHLRHSKLNVVVKSNTFQRERIRILFSFRSFRSLLMIYI